MAERTIIELRKNLKATQNMEEAKRLRDQAMRRADDAEREVRSLSLELERVRTKLTAAESARLSFGST